MEKIMLGAGCFWGVQQILDRVAGVTRSFVGYTGGSTENPTYREICSGQTGHAEVVLVEFDESVLSLAELLDYFWRLHNPTTLNKQGVDIGSQYRSAIYFYDRDQEKVAIQSKNNFDQSEVYSDMAVTEITAAGEFHMGEEYHQKYFAKNPSDGCHILRPK